MAEVIYIYIKKVNIFKLNRDRFGLYILFTVVKFSINWFSISNIENITIIIEVKKKKRQKINKWKDFIKIMKRKENNQQPTAHIWLLNINMLKPGSVVIICSHICIYESIELIDCYLYFFLTILQDGLSLNTIKSIFVVVVLLIYLYIEKKNLMQLINK